MTVELLVSGKFFGRYYKAGETITSDCVGCLLDLVKSGKAKKI